MNLRPTQTLWTVLAQADELSYKLTSVKKIKCELKNVNGTFYRIQQIEVRLKTACRAYSCALY